MILAIPIGYFFVALATAFSYRVYQLRHDPERDGNPILLGPFEAIIIGVIWPLTILFGLAIFLGNVFDKLAKRIAHK